MWTCFVLNLLSLFTAPLSALFCRTIVSRGVNKVCTKWCKKSHFLNVDSSFNIENKVFKLSMLILHIGMQGTVSQISYSCPSFVLCDFFYFDIK